MAITQDTRLLSVNTPLGGDALLLESFTGTESISQVFEFTLFMISERQSIPFESLVGDKVTVRMSLADGSDRHLNGYVREIALVTSVGGRRRFQADVVPWLWFLTQTTNCRIFQNKKVPEIVKQVFADRGFSGDVVDRLQGQYEPRDYCVQYRETDFNFVSRLMEEEGIFYFFEHSDGNHKLVLADSPGAHQPCPGQSEARFHVGDVVLDDDMVVTFRKEHHFCPGKYTLADYHFAMPSTALKSTTASVASVRGNGKYELFDYPGYYARPRFDDGKAGKVQPDGDRTVKLRMEAEETQHQRIFGTGTCRAFIAGGKFNLVEHPSSELNGGYVLTGVNHEATSNLPDSGASGYSNSFAAIPASTPFRPMRAAAKPVVEGLQTAVVVGPSGEEIHTDKYGRVKVQFHWDREGRKDEKSSCWVRVAQQWAGKRWGMYFTPRIGQEVLVAFLEGDPDQPIIVGSVYNAEQMPPYLGDGPDDNHKNDPHVSGIKTNTTKGGQGFNELRFDDTKDKQQIFIHAERDMDCRVKNDSRELILGNRHLIVGSDDGGGDRFEQIHRDNHLNVKRHQIEHVEGNYELLVGKGDAGGGNLDVAIASDKKEKIDGAQHLVVGGAQMVKVGGDHSLTIGGAHQEKVGTDFNVESGMTMHIKSGMTLVLEAGVQLSLKVGGNFIDINAGGVFIQGTMVMINSGGAAGSGMGANPVSPQNAKDAAPTEPDEADNAKTGSKSC